MSFSKALCNQIGRVRLIHVYTGITDNAVLIKVTTISVHQLPLPHMQSINDLIYQGLQRSSREFGY
jgi:hypothetical protein